MSTLSSSGDRVVPALARELAARLSMLFERDVEIVERLNDAQTRSVCSPTVQGLPARVRSRR
jgi:hypothetical protein